MNEKTIDLFIILFFTLVIVAKRYVIFGLLFAIALLVLCVLARGKEGKHERVSKS
ncbi:hypothetical protein [Enterococcus faecium]|uniref:hypothetical protein n=1 Tax=Enterococcus faecium TaxID=1352 RepID=UPI0015E2BAD8|nr:hypothetical protein [Enterococcus faecium]EME3512034.1 hypothetical protein [Enterococcus faecium]EME3547350.1 hypothetical protein [Enterococcus faecium]EME7093985.1 hypothetical protein [Enterococcus faecium]EME7139151.1 hypothetical protein [Enterococcus faecium]EME7167578.1 hypothetical protein [Enterococcus faecium]